MSFFDDLGSIFSGANASPTAPSTAQPAAPATDPQGFTGGLMGMQPNSPGLTLTRNALGALGQSLMTSPSNDLLRDFNSSFQAQTKASTADSQKQALVAAMRARGMNDEQIMQALRQGGLLSPLEALMQPAGLTSLPAASSSPSLMPPANGAPGGLDVGSNDQFGKNRSFV